MALGISEFDFIQAALSVISNVDVRIRSQDIVSSIVITRRLGVA